MRPIPAEPPPFFHRGPSPLARLAFFGLASIVLLFVDARYRTLEDVRHTVGAVLYPIQRALRVPGEAVESLAAYFASKRELDAENAKLRAELISQAPAAQGYASAREDMAFYRHVDEVMASPDTWRGKNMQVHGFMKELRNKPGSLEYKQKEEELARMQSDLQVQVGLKRKEFLEQEARVYFHVYRDIEQVVAQFAQRYRIDLVLRFNGDPMKEDDRASVLQGVNRAIVYQNGRDITQSILAELNRIYPPAPAATSPAAGGPAGTISRPFVPGRPATGPAGGQLK